MRETLAACRNGDTLVGAKLDRLARSFRDAKGIIDEITITGVKLSIGGSVYDPTDPDRSTTDGDDYKMGKAQYPAAE